MPVSQLEELLAGQLRMIGAPKPQREHRFHGTRRWRFDFAWPDRKIAVEVDGGSWTAGRHNRGAGFESDCLKSCEAAIAGWRVLHVSTDMVSDGRALTLIERALEAA